VLRRIRPASTKHRIKNISFINWMQDTETEHRMQNAGYNLTKIRCILSRKGKTEDYSTLYVQFMQRTDIFVPITKGKVQSLLNTVKDT